MKKINICVLVLKIIVLFVIFFFLGYQMAFDSSKSALTKNNFAVGFSNGDFTLHTNVNDGQVSRLNCFHS